MQVPEFFFGILIFASKHGLKPTAHRFTKTTTTCKLSIIPWYLLVTKISIQSFSSEIIQFWRCFSLPWHANRPAIGGTSSASDLSVQRSFLQATARYGLMLQSNLPVLCFMIFFFFLSGYDLP